ncbi:MAG: hypothetical protein ABSG11_07085 [Candidatus Korobacteraceae bacterium]|jgi:predicted alpha/beta hydrolase
MSEKMTERQRAVVVNIAILVGLIWCYFHGYPPKIILGSGIFLLAFANILMYLKHRRASTQV